MGFLIGLAVFAFIIFMAVYSFKHRKEYYANREKRRKESQEKQLAAAIKRRERHLHEMRTNPMYAIEYERQGREGRSTLEIMQIAKDDVLIEKAVREGKIPPIQ
ncbi:hypothetical protein LJC49_07000 [Ruminococcaceae bacterium OttesenSCG-928-I18]|nr:hypothetical protein [Ruminococcaceae bacterium OttesenSCG-928-I18]